MEEKEIKILTIACLIAFFTVCGAYAYTFFMGIDQAIALNSTLHSNQTVQAMSNTSNPSTDHANATNITNSTSNITTEQTHNSTPQNNNQFLISAQDAKNIAQSMEMQSGTTIGTPHLSTLNGQPVYYVPIYDQTGSKVGKIIIDAQTGAVEGEG